MDTRVHPPLPDCRLCGTSVVQQQEDGHSCPSASVYPIKQEDGHSCPSASVYPIKQEDGHSCPSQLAPPLTLRHKSVPTPIQQTGGWTLLSIAAGPPSTLRHKSVPPPIQQTGGWTLLSIAASPTIDSAAQECATSCPARNSGQLLHQYCSVAASSNVDTKRPVSTFVNTGHNTGDNLLSHPSVGALPSAVTGLTSVFEKGTCVSLHLWSPELVS